jgi:hypothetical protein
VASIDTTMLSGVLRSALAALSLVIAGCGSGSGGHSCATQGIAWLSWTIQGQPPSETSCRAIDHLSVEMHTPCGSVVIDPIPCLRGLGWEYDGLPEGTTTIVLDAFDARGNLTLQAINHATFSKTRDAMTTPFDLR